MWLPSWEDGFIENFKMTCALLSTGLVDQNTVVNLLKHFWSMNMAPVNNGDFEIIFTSSMFYWISFNYKLLK